MRSCAALRLNGRECPLLCVYVCISLASRWSEPDCAPETEGETGNVDERCHPRRGAVLPASCLVSHRAHSIDDGLDGIRVGGGGGVLQSESETREYRLVVIIRLCCRSLLRMLIRNKYSFNGTSQINRVTEYISPTSSGTRCATDWHRAIIRVTLRLKVCRKIASRNGKVSIGDDITFNLSPALWIDQPAVLMSERGVHGCPFRLYRFACMQQPDRQV